MPAPTYSSFRPVTASAAAKYAYLAALTWHEARDLLASRPVGILPVGAIEAHGPHLPLDTDVLIAEATADALGTVLLQRGVSAIRLPPITYSTSFVGTSFPGTSPVGPGMLQAYVTDVLTHASTQGYRALLICNAHLEPAHVAALHDVVSALRGVTPVPVLFVDQRVEPYASQLSAEFAAGARHAGAYETAILLAAAPYSVRREALRHLPPVWIDLPAALRAGAATFSAAGMTDAYVGDPASATADEGERLLDRLAAMQVTALLDAGVI